MSNLTPDQIRDLTAHVFAQIIIASPVNSDWTIMHTTAENTINNWVRKNGIQVVPNDPESKSPVLITPKR